MKGVGVGRWGAIFKAFRQARDYFNTAQWKTTSFKIAGPVFPNSKEFTLTKIRVIFIQ